MKINEKRVQQQIRNFQRALEGYAYNEPLARYLTRFFKENKQMGSSDRRMTSRFCYNYFRLGNSLKEFSIENRLSFAEYLCEQESSVVQLFHPSLSDSIGESLLDKIRILSSYIDFDLNQVFPYLDHLSQSIDLENFVKSHFVQPDLFLRIKKGNENLVVSSLEAKGFDYTIVENHTLRLPNGSKLQELSKLEGKFEVQDLSSQRTIEFMEAKHGESWWDACAASGGKALMFLDHYPKTNLLVSDIRLSILRNLDERFEKARIPRSYRKKVLDLTQNVSSILGSELFDGIILDAPCSGSGTWGRTPEMIQQFSAEKLVDFSNLQKKIASNVIAYLKEGKPLIYMTCSVYKDENEDVVSYLVSQFDLEVENMELIKGYDQKADSMFAARLIKRK